MPYFELIDCEWIRKFGSGNFTPWGTTRAGGPQPLALQGALREAIERGGRWLPFVIHLYKFHQCLGRMGTKARPLLACSVVPRSTVLTYSVATTCDRIYGAEVVPKQLSFSGSIPKGEMPGTPLTEEISDTGEPLKR